MPGGAAIRTAFMIPAWQIFDTSHYDGARGEAWALEDP